MIAAMPQRYNVYDNNCQKMSVDLLNRICNVRTGRFAPSWDRNNPTYIEHSPEVEIIPVTMTKVDDDES